MNILMLVGSLRADSWTGHLVGAIPGLLPEGVESEVYAGIGDLPHYDQDLDTDGAPGAVVAFREALAQADALVVATPEYNGSVPGVLKNAIDWASRPPGGGAPLWGKTAAVAGATTGQYGALWAQQDLRRILGIAGARVLAGELPIARAQTLFDEALQLRDPLVAERLRTHLEALVQDASVPLAA